VTFSRIQNRNLHLTIPKYYFQVNFCVAQRACEQCKDDWSADNPCASCGQREYIFEGEDTLDKFCEWLFCEEHKDCTVSFFCIILRRSNVKRR